MRLVTYLGQVLIEQECALRYRTLAHHCRRQHHPAFFRTNMFFARMHMRILHKLLRSKSP